MALKGTPLDGEGWRRVADAIVERRTELRLTQSDLSNRSEVSTSTIQRLERAPEDDAAFSKRVLRQVSEALDWPADALETVGGGGEVEVAAVVPATTPGSVGRAVAVSAADFLRALADELAELDVELGDDHRHAFTRATGRFRLGEELDGGAGAVDVGVSVGADGERRVGVAHERGDGSEVGASGVELGAEPVAGVVDGHGVRDDAGGGGAACVGEEAAGEVVGVRDSPCRVGDDVYPSPAKAEGEVLLGLADAPCVEGVEGGGGEWGFGGGRRLSWGRARGRGRCGRWCGSMASSWAWSAGSLADTGMPWK